jgi:hypothetical protein
MDCEHCGGLGTICDADGCEEPANSYGCKPCGLFDLCEDCNAEHQEHQPDPNQAKLPLTEAPAA